MREIRLLLLLFDCLKCPLVLLFWYWGSMKALNIIDDREEKELAEMVKLRAMADLVVTVYPPRVDDVLPTVRMWMRQYGRHGYRA